MSTTEEGSTPETLCFEQNLRIVPFTNYFNTDKTKPNFDQQLQDNPTLPNPFTQRPVVAGSVSKGRSIIMSLKRKATDVLPVRPKKPAPPRASERPVLDMVLHLTPERNVQVKVLLDSGSSIPLISSRLTSKFSLVTHKRDQPITVERFDGTIAEGVGLLYSHPLLLQYGDHYTKETFDVSPTDNECNIVLPWWWMVKHPPTYNLEGQNIRVKSEQCLRNCTRASAQALEIEYDDDVARVPKSGPLPKILLLGMG